MLSFRKLVQCADYLSSGISASPSGRGMGLVPGRVRSRQWAGPGGGRLNWGEVGGLARADILMEHWDSGG